jgi:hypothetical protein
MDSLYGGARFMKIFHAALLLAALSPTSPMFAGPERSAAETLVVPRFEIVA